MRCGQEWKKALIECDQEFHLGFTTGDYIPKFEKIDLCNSISESIEKHKSLEKEEFQRMLNLAQQGNLDAMANLCGHYHKGIGTDIDNEKAVEWAICGAKGGNKIAAMQLAYFSKNNLSPRINANVAAQIYQYYANQGDKLACSLLAECYLQGMGVNRSVKTAQEWALKAENTSVGEYILGLCCLNDTLLHPYDKSKYKQKAREHFEKAVKAGDCTYQTANVLYELGLLAEKENPIKSEAYQITAYMFHSPKGTLKLAELFSDYRSPLKDYSSSTALYYEYFNQKLAYFDQKGKVAFELGNAYRDGIGVKKNEDLMLLWYKRAASYGNVPAIKYLGDYYLHLNFNLDKALDYYSAGTEKGDIYSIDVLTNYFKIIGDKETADYWDISKKSILGIPIRTENENERLSNIQTLFQFEIINSYLGLSKEEADKIYGENSPEALVAKFFQYYLHPELLLTADLHTDLNNYLACIKPMKDPQEIAEISWFIGSSLMNIFDYALNISDYNWDKTYKFLEKNNVLYRECSALAEKVLNIAIKAYSIEGPESIEQYCWTLLSKAEILFLLSKFEESNEVLHSFITTMRDYIIKNAKNWNTQKISEFCYRWNLEVSLESGIFLIPINSDKMPKLSEDLYDICLINKDILRNLEYKSNFEQTNIPTWDKIQKLLKKDEAAIEILRSWDALSGKPYYRAIILTKNESPKHLSLGYEKNFIDYINQGTTYTSDLSYTYFWAPFEPYIKNCHTIYYSPDGIFQQMQIEAVPYDGASFVDQHYNIVRLSSTSQLLNNHQTSDINQVLLIGGLNYNHGLDPADEYKLKRYGVNELPESKQEVNDIAVLLQNKELRYSLLQGDSGDEITIKKTIPGKDIIHIASHGYYWNDKEINLYKNLSFIKEANSEDLPRLASGLMVTGVNNTLCNRNLPSDPKMDGFLTSKEITTLDLSQAQLVVLSACQSGMGNITSMGVDGLQYALKAAGAKSMLLSLWKVDDKATRLLMEEFYRHLLNGHTKKEALIAARHYLRNYSEETLEGLDNIKIKPYESPLYWGAFVLIDAIE